ncbi:bifunctional 5,10-methylenetetrahydrofolate dehydrogenase/5,10-methenyltetrahydrofolate cyclohydrolase [Clostridium algidicarnis]|uniref:Bifunctional protein FolD n=2 Tax=Clostridium algidicarnis TaxID=37659 RepID=A0A2S6G1L1_9CLOT|nr:tetrahydrofolate dehydrogenase/cyclohydrolase catalytic domain-containing protein [Clostridium algidicarnis]MBB6631282.1 bifunctional methylenetetrahydrofolate dehydrogenase/methenyltetrahydrofolate cyclohydrolase [Clostridium algidicarnis]MBB6697599.1 bifunctional methylenetetrahydrofolate dehydrogenase/methenyltetrahydrofolate cyclohydrolase [Clostridium algidicarnis]MBU3193806.1 bifunctional methylenetetrahydrofolate dehydrogenase/methenyltetrahydrofolate cyclohydrolase [Clostridium algidi
MGNIINGKEIAKFLKNDIRKFAEDKKNQGNRVPCLATITVGQDGGSIYYVNSQIKLCKDLGLEPKHFSLDESITEEELINLIEKLNNDKSVDGIMLQLPLPKHINEKEVSSKINYKKDIDGLTDINLGRFYKGEKAFVPCTANSALELIKNTGIKIQGKRVVVLGRSNIVGKPSAQLLLNENATVTICHSKTENLKAVCKEADILVVAIGRPQSVGKDYIKEGAVVIDVGTSSVNGKITGDVIFDEVLEIASFVSPVPGGVGSMTTTLLMKNLCEAFKENVY